MSRSHSITAGPGHRTWVDTLPIVRRLLRSHRRIAIIWAVEDVQWLRPDLDEEQAWAVLTHAENHHDATVGVNWDTLSAAAEALHPEQEETP